MGTHTLFLRPVPLPLEEMERLCIVELDKVIEENKDKPDMLIEFQAVRVLVERHYYELLHDLALDFDIKVNGQKIKDYDIDEEIAWVAVDGYYDTFRYSGDPELELKSLADTLALLTDKSKKISFKNDWQARINEFWGLYPNGKIVFR